LGSPIVITAVCAMFFAAASWESLRLFGHQLTIPVAMVWTAIFVWLAYTGMPVQFMFVWLLAVLAWLVKFIPSLKFGLPNRQGVANRIYSVLYQISILGTFLAVLIFERLHSATYLLSVMAIVWVADIGAYFSGKRFGKSKLAPVISPGKSWEGAVGGWLCVLLIAIISTQLPFLTDTFSVAIQRQWGWAGLLLVLSLLTSASVIGDLVESQLKRRAEVKDSSNLLPGHGGVLDRIDALISVLPLAMLIQMILNYSKS